MLVGHTFTSASVGAQPPVAGPPPIPGLDLPGLQEWIDRIVPPPALGPVTNSPLVDADRLEPDLAALRAAVMPDPIGDAFVDYWPPNLDTFAPGEVIGVRDVTATGGPILFPPVRQVLQLKFRTTDAAGLPSYAIASLVVPTGEWAGNGDRPIVVNNVPINGLGRDCNPSYTFVHGITTETNLSEFIPPTTQLAVARGYAVLIPDHEGPRMAYAEPFVAGHAVLDAMRAVRGAFSDEFGDSVFGMIGYSGGAIATNAASKLMSTYAPELTGVVVGAALGGVPVDYELLARSMNANLASGVFFGATFAIGRERPEILAHMNHLAQWIAVSPMKNQCVDVFALPGIFHLPMDVAANFPDPLHSDLAEEIYRITRLEDRKSAVPLYIYHGQQEFWVPLEGARNLADEQCALGTDVVYRSVFGEHVVAAVTGYPEAILWLDARLRGEPAVSEC
ncbi:lipase family protein [Nocardia sp. NPDC050406]|uniref:lipase family protein n=1 Tax=Nocardia sp. NPDC050406 TaxID=3364318 RepID=UPI00378904F9